MAEIELTDDAKRQDIFRRIAQALPGAETVTPGKALALTQDNRVVDHDDPEAAFVLVGENGTLPADVAKELGVKAHKRTDEEEEQAQARIAAGRGNFGPQPAAAPVLESEASPAGVSVQNAVPGPATLEFGGKRK